MKELRKKLKNTEPYLIQTKLFDKLFFQEDEKREIEGKSTEYWIFFYSFIRRLQDEAIGVRVWGYDRHHIYRKTLKILKNNKTVIENFLKEQTTK